jgi:hypothetical protein
MRFSLGIAGRDADRLSKNWALLLVAVQDDDLASAAAVE